MLAGPQADPTKICSWPHEQTKYDWKSQCEAFRAKTIVPTVKHGVGSIMLWNWFTNKMNRIVKENCLQFFFNFPQLNSQACETVIKEVNNGKNIWKDWEDKAE